MKVVELLPVVENPTQPGKSATHRYSLAESELGPLSDPSAPFNPNNRPLGQLTIFPYFFVPKST